MEEDENIDGLVSKLEYNAKALQEERVKRMIELDTKMTNDEMARFIPSAINMLMRILHVGMVKRELFTLTFENGSVTICRPYNELFMFENREIYLLATCKQFNFMYSFNLSNKAKILQMEGYNPFVKTGGSINIHCTFIGQSALSTYKRSTMKDLSLLRIALFSMYDEALYESEPVREAIYYNLIQMLAKTFAFHKKTLPISFLKPVHQALGYFYHQRDAKKLELMLFDFQELIENGWSHTYIDTVESGKDGIIRINDMSDFLVDYTSYLDTATRLDSIAYHINIEKADDGTYE